MAMEAGMIGHISKPIDMNVLENEIELTHSYECGLFFIKPSSLLHLILS